MAPISPLCGDVQTTDEYFRRCIDVSHQAINGAIHNDYSFLEKLGLLWDPEIVMGGLVCALLVVGAVKCKNRYLRWKNPPPPLSTPDPREDAIKKMEAVYRKQLDDMNPRITSIRKRMETLRQIPSSILAQAAQGCEFRDADQLDMAYNDCMMMYDIVLDQLRLGEGLSAEDISMKLQAFEDSLKRMSEDLTNSSTESARSVTNALAAVAAARNRTDACFFGLEPVTGPPR